MKKKALVIIIFLILLGIISFNLQTLFQNKTNKEKQKSVITWGNNSFGQLGAGVLGQYSLSNQAVSSAGLEKIEDISSGLNHTLALDKEGNVWSWGNNKYGQLGDGTDSSQRLVPQKINGLNSVKSISAGQNHSVALKNDGTIWIWGHNLSGELGTGDNKDRRTPVQVTGLNTVKTISAGYRFSIALKEDGSLWGWGGKCVPSNQDDFKQFIGSIAENASGGGEDSYLDASGGDINTLNQYNDCIGEDYLNIKTNSPVRLDGITDIKSIATGFGHILVLKNDGTVWATGCNKYGQVGIGQVGNSDKNKEFGKVLSLTNVVSLAAGYRHSLALKEDGTIWGWGHNTQGQLGLGDKGDITEPIQIKSLSNIRSINAGHDFTLALDKNDVLWGMGESHYGVLGDLSKSEDISLVPIKVTTISDVEKISSGGGHATILIKN
jgi:alpha-tubulin suppressor-like RCC1 family protein